MCASAMSSDRRKAGRGMTATDPLDVGELRQLLALRKAYPNDAGTLDDVMVAAYNSLPALLDALAAARAEIKRLTALREDIAAEVLAPIEALAAHWALMASLDTFDGKFRFHMEQRADDLRAALSTAKEATKHE
jgi:hypothetical protein